jgi:glycosyltransferase involved in cell wall biosynthesis
MGIKISVVIPTYQRTDLLLQTLESLRNQTIDPALFEVIAIDDATPSGEVKQKTITSQNYPFQFQYLIQAKGGPAKARNLGIKKSSGTIIIFMDDDAVADSEWIKNIVQSLESSTHSGVGGITKNYKIETLSEKLLNHVGHLISPIDPITGEVIFLVTVNAAFYKKDLHDVGGFDENFKLPSGEDMDLGFRMRKVGKTLGLSEGLVYHHQRDSLCSMFRNWYNYGRGLYRCQLKHKESLNNLDSYSDTSLLNTKKFTKHIKDYFDLYKSLWKSENINFFEVLLLPNLHLLNFIFFILGRYQESKNVRTCNINRAAPI